MSRRCVYSLAWLVALHGMHLVGYSHVSDSSNSHIQRLVDARELCGEWVLRGATPSEVSRSEQTRGASEHPVAFSLYPDETCQLLGPSDYLGAIGIPLADASHGSACGRWAVSRAGDYAGKDRVEVPVVRLDFRFSRESDSSVHVSESTCRFLIREDQQGRVVLWDYSGDPDSGRRVEYVLRGHESKTSPNGT